MNYVIIHFNLLGLRKETLMKNFKWINVLKGFGMGTSDLHSFSETSCQPQKANPEQWQDADKNELRKKRSK